MRGEKWPKVFLFPAAAAVMLLVLLAAAGCAGKGQAAKGQAGGAMAVPVAVETVKRGTVVKEIVAGGQLSAVHSVVVAPKISGKVASVPVQLGSRVAASDILFTLDDAEIAAQVRQSEAALAAARARLGVAAYNRENAQKQYERYRQLYEQGAISADTFDAYILKLEQARSGEPEAAVEQAEANLAYYRNQLANTVITSPLDGVVAQCGVEVGSMVTPSTQAVTVVDLSRMKVQVFVGEEHIGKIKEGQEAKVVVPALEDRSFTGVIENLSPAADQKTKAYTVEIGLDNPGEVLKQGMFAEVRLAVGRSEGALTVPVDALLTRSDGTAVYTVKDGVAKKTRVETGISDGSVVEIKSGLQEGDWVVVVGQQGLVDGAKVMVSD